MDITVRDLIEQLKGHEPEAIVHFGGLDFYRVKSRGEKLVQIEFNETVYKDDNGNVVVLNQPKED